MYNRIVSKRIIRRKTGDWFDVEWKRHAGEADTRTWLRTYDESWKNWGAQDLSPHDIEMVSQRVPAGASVLDAGCGDGYLLDSLTVKAGQCTGVDVSGSALELAAHRLEGKKIMLVQAFLENLPFSDNSFDVVVSAHTLEHVRELERAAAELKRVASRRLVVLVPAQESLPYTEDYHLHFFLREDDLARAIGIPGAECIRYESPRGNHKYSGDILLLTADL